MEDIPVIFELTDPEALQVLNSPQRLRILRLLVEPHTVRELAEKLDAPVTRLYYHVNLLEEVGVIRVVATRKMGAMTQKVYRAVARGFRPGREILSGGYDPALLAKASVATVLDSARVDAEDALRAHFERVAAGEDPEVSRHGALGRTIVRLSKDQADRYVDRIVALLEELDEMDTEEGEEYGFSYSFFPLSPGDAS